MTSCFTSYFWQLPGNNCNWLTDWCWTKTPRIFTNFSYYACRINSKVTLLSRTFTVISNVLWSIERKKKKQLFNFKFINPESPWHHRRMMFSALTSAIHSVTLPKVIQFSKRLEISQKASNLGEWQNYSQMLLLDSILKVDFWSKTI